MRRLFWGIVGIGLGAVVGAQVVRWANKTKARYAPPNIARAGASKLAELRERASAAIAAGAQEMIEREVEIRDEIGLPPA